MTALLYPRRTSTASKMNRRTQRKCRPALEILEERALLTGLPQLIKDINPDPQEGLGSGIVSGFTEVGGIAYFGADDGSRGHELWRSDGTDAGTFLVKDIQPNGSFPNGSHPRDLTSIGSTLFFSASDSSNGGELWKSNGTTGGTVLVEDINPGSGSSNPSFLTNVGGMLFFAAFNDELWRSDGTAAGTFRVKDINAGAISSGPSFLTNVGGTLFFTALDDTHGTELWKSDGTAAGTVLVKDINPGIGSSQLFELTNVGGTLYFTAFDPVAGFELWKSNGTEAGTVRVKDIIPGDESSLPVELTDVNGTLFFTAYTTGNGQELWKSDGTDPGTVLVKDISPGLADSSPVFLTNVNGTLFFRAYDAVAGGELWKSNGTAAGTVRIKDVVPGDGGSDPTSFFSIGSTLYFSATSSSDGTERELWTSDGTEAGTSLVMNINTAGSSDPRLFANIAGDMFFVAGDHQHGDEPWILHDAAGNLPPMADAGGPYSVIQGGSVVLSGSGSDPENDALTFTWDLDGDGVFGESGSAALRGDEVGANPTFTAPTGGPPTVVVTLRVSTAGAFTDDTAVITILPPASTFKWTGGSPIGGNWTYPANWQGNVAPSPGSDLDFTGASGRFTTVNDYPAGTFFKSITLGTSNYRIDGNRLALGNGGFVVSSGNQVLTMSFDTQPSDPAPFAEPISIAAGSSLTLTGVIGGALGLHQKGGGTLVLAGANTFTGLTRIDAGILELHHSLSLGSTTGVTELHGGTSLLLRNNISIGEDLNLVGVPPGTPLPGVRFISDGNNTVNGKLATNPLLSITTVNGTLNLTGIISGIDDLIKDGLGTLVLTADNTLQGTITIKTGTLLVQGSQPQAPIIVQGGFLGGTGLMGTITLAGGQLLGPLFQASPIHAGQRDLVIAGSVGHDAIKIRRGSHASLLAVSIREGNQATRNFNNIPGSIDRIVVYAQEGNDFVSVDHQIDHPAWLYGHSGNDLLKGGNGDDVLLGGSGIDLLYGGGGRDLIIGGTGSDIMKGGADDDLLIAASTDHDANLVALNAIMTEWTRTNVTYVQRIAHIDHGGGMNGTYFLNDRTVHEDAAIDVLFGSSGRDLYFAKANGGLRDLLLDLIATELVIDLH